MKFLLSAALLFSNLGYSLTIKCKGTLSGDQYVLHEASGNDYVFFHVKRDQSEPIVTQIYSDSSVLKTDNADKTYYIKFISLADNLKVDLEIIGKTEAMRGNMATQYPSETARKEEVLCKAKGFGFGDWDDWTDEDDWGDDDWSDGDDWDEWDDSSWN